VPGGAVRVEEYHATGGVVEPGSRRTIIQFDTPKQPGFTNHNAGWIGFNPVNGATGPNSGHLHILTGDSGGGNDPLNVAQNKDSFQGKLLRIDVNTPAGGNNYSIPSGNMTGVNVKPELYSYGLRNPFRAGFDRQTGDLYIGDVGQGDREEIDFVPNGMTGGLNFGWRVREGRVQNPAFLGAPVPPDAVDPIYDYGRGLGASVTGGYVYRGPSTDHAGTYFFGDFVSGRIWSFDYTGEGIPTDLALERTNELQTAINTGTVGSISSFAEDGFGNLFVIDYFGGEVFQIVPVPEPGSVGLVAGGVLAGAAGWRRVRRRTA
jgi:hypothetical protein